MSMNLSNKSVHMVLKEAIASVLNSNHETDSSIYDQIGAPIHLSHCALRKHDVIDQLRSPQVMTSSTAAAAARKSSRS